MLFVIRYYVGIQFVFKFFLYYDFGIRDLCILFILKIPFANRMN